MQNLGDKELCAQPGQCTIHIMKPIRQTAAEQDESVAELWARFIVNEYHVPVMLNLPRSSWDLLKRTSSPKVFGIGKRRYIIVEDLKKWLVETRDRWEPKPAKRLYRVGPG